MKLRKALLLALPVVGLAACESEPEESRVATAYAKAQSTTTLEVTTTSRVREFDEVQVVPDSLQKSSKYFWKVQLKATNHSSKTSTYYIDFACYYQGVQHDVSYASIKAVPPNETIAVESSCFDEEVDEVRIVSVERNETVGR